MNRVEVAALGEGRFAGRKVPTDGLEFALQEE